ncbi:MAG TPA: hypothetical protein VEZ50_07075 [Nodosilinea sp.]|nr:hypothetical protein [Nodosilinea sp.]
MATRFAPPEQSRPLWQMLLAPMLLASLALHGLVLLLPAGSSDEAVIPPPDPEQDSVAITRVPPAGAPDAAAVATPVPTAATPPSAAQPLAAAVPQPQGRAPVVRPAVVPQPVQRPRPTASRPQASPPPPPSPQPQGPPASTSASASGAATAPAAAAPAQPTPSSSPLFGAEVGEGLLSYIAALNLPQSQVERAAESIQNRFGFNAAAVTREALNHNQRQWEAAIRQATGLAELSPETERTAFTTVYPQRVCLAEEPGEVRIGAVANPDGSWRGEPALLRSSGYGALDEKALQEIQRHRFDAADGIRAYILTVDTSVNYGPQPCLDPNPAA